MKKIRKISDEKKTETRNKIIISVLLVGVMVFGTLGYFFQPKDQDDSRKKVTYKNIDFESQGNYWVSNIKEKYFIFSYNPYEITRTNSDLKGIENYYNKPLYVYPSETNEAILEIIRNLSPQFRRDYIIQRSQEACLSQEDCIGKDFPIKDCSENFIIVRESNETKIIQEDNCVFIEGKQEDLLKLADEFLFHILGVRE